MFTMIVASVQLIPYPHIRIWRYFYSSLLPVIHILYAHIKHSSQ